MSLDMHISLNGKIHHLEMSEAFHSSIFSNSTRWSSFKRLRKLKDYYRADSVFKGGEAVSFLNELFELCANNNLFFEELEKIKILIDSKRVDVVRITSD